MILKRELDDLKSLARSNWVKSGLALQVAACLIVGFFIVDIRWCGGKAFFAMVFADEFDGGVAFDAVWYSVLSLAIAGGLCILIGCARVVKHRSGLPNQALDGTA